MSTDHDREKVLSAFGGVKGLVDSGIPSLLFLIVFNIRKDLTDAIYAALATSLVLTVIRLAMRETIQHAVGGLLGVAFSAGIAYWTGHAGDFFISKLAINALYALVYTGANIAGWPLLGVLLGPILGENFAWRNDPPRKAAYIRAGWLWVGLFVIRLAIQVPIYLKDDVTTLGIVNLAMGIPPYLLTAAATWWILKKVPTTKPPAELTD
jgi:intracellular septation protein A